jgi:SPP1 family phage portal protein
LETSELFKDALVFGVGYEVLWTTAGQGDSVLVAEFKKVNPSSIEIVYSNDIKPIKLAAFYFWKDNVTDAEFVDIYFPLKKERWTKTNSTWAKAAKGDEIYPYKTVPVVPFRANPDQDALFEAEKPLIDAHDTLLSKSVNEIDRFNALITLFPGKITKELKDKLQDIQVLEKLEEYEADKWPKFLEKNLAGITDFYSGLADRLERLFHKSVKDPDMTSEAFAGGEQSGVAIAYKLLGLEFKASELDTYFNQGIFERDNLIKDVIDATTQIVADDYKTIVKTHRNLPVDEKVKLEIAIAMRGVGISVETILKFLPISIIENAEKELERMEANKQDLDKKTKTNILEDD